jgi:hypothetical protein
MRDYRRQAVERIVSRCIKQHGIVLAHTFGTGKTLTIGVLLKNFPLTWKKLLLAPSDVHEQWQKVSDSLDLGLEIVDIYGPIPAAAPREVMVVDEAHLLIPQVNTPLVKRFGQATKLVLATGTPFVEDAASLHVLVNLAAGKQVLPSDPDQFTRKYMYVSPASAAIYGWIIPLGEKIFRLFFVGRGAIFAVLSTFLLHTKIQQTVQRTMWVKRLQDGIDDPTDYRYTAEQKQGMKDTLELLKKTRLEHMPRAKAEHDENLQGLDAKIAALKSFMSAEEVEESSTDSQTPQPSLIAQFDEHPDVPYKDKALQDKAILVAQLGALKSVRFAAWVDANLTYSQRAVVIYLAISMLWKLAYLQTSEARRDLRTLDVNKLSKDVAPYLLIFDPFQSNDKDILKHFPIATDRVEYTTLSAYQLLQLQRMAKNKLDYELLKTMQFVKNPEEMAGYVQRLAEQQKQMEDLGRMASNLAPKGQVPAKFDLIFEMHEKKPVPTVVYSNFERGMQLFLEAVNEHTKFKAEIYTKRSQLERALDGEVDFLILPPQSTQGVDLPGMGRMHILEPLLNAATFSQLRARVIRYVHDSTVRNRVEIIQWVAKLPSGGWIAPKAMSAIFQYWGEYESSLVPTETFAKVVLTAPDEIVYARLQKILVEFHEVESLLLRASQKAVFPDAQCCIWKAPGAEREQCQMETCADFWSRYEPGTANPRLDEQSDEDVQSLKKIPRSTARRSPKKTKPLITEETL